MKKTLFAIGILTFLLSCTNQNGKVETKFGGVSSSGYSQRVEVSGSNYKTVYISGQVAVDTNGNLVGINNLQQQTEQVFKNIKSQVEKAGGTMDDIVNIDCYLTDLSKTEEFRTARAKFINLKNPPASTVVQVERLINEYLLLEVSAVAVISIE